MGQPAPDEWLGQELYYAASSGDNQLNIGTADYLISKAQGGGSVTTIAQLITWASAMSARVLEIKAKELEQLEDGQHYSDVVLDKPVADLDASWNGTGADAFVLRWQQLQQYVGKARDGGRRNALVAQVAAMRDLMEGIKALQKTLLSSVNGGGLSQVRHEYVKALCSEGNSTVFNETVAGVGLGATIGSPGSWPGVAAGGIIGGVYGLIKGIMADSEANLKRIAGAEVAISNVGAQFQGLDKTLVLRPYGDNNKVDLNGVDYAPSHPYGGDWSDLNGGWTAGG